MPQSNPVQPPPADVNRLYGAALTMPVSVYQRWRAEQQKDLLRGPPKLQPVAKTPYGVNKAVAPPKPGQTLAPDKRLENPGPNAYERPGL